MRNAIETLLDSKFTDYNKLTAALRNAETIKNFNAGEYLDTGRIIQHVRSQKNPDSMSLDFPIDEVSLIHA